MPRPGVCRKETRGDFEMISQKAMRCVVVVNLAQADLYCRQPLPKGGERGGGMKRKGTDRRSKEKREKLSVSGVEWSSRGRRVEG